MLTDSQNVAITTLATSNVFAGRPIEFIGAPSICRLLLTADLPSATAQMLINVGGDQKVPIAAGTSVNVAAAPGAGPKEDEDQIATNIPLPLGSRNQLNIFNGNAATNNVRYRATILP